MGKKKLIRFAQNENFTFLHQPDAKELLQTPHPFRGNWANRQFGNQNELVLELGCGRGEYATGLAKMFPEKNFIGIDIKGSRLFFAAGRIVGEKIANVALVRCAIDLIDRIFYREVSEIWITFPDPYTEKVRRRLTSPFYLNRYVNTLKPHGGLISLKTDDAGLYGFTRWIAESNRLKIIKNSSDLHSSDHLSAEEKILTTYEQKFMAAGKPIHLLKFILDREVSQL